MFFPLWLVLGWSAMVSALVPNNCMSLLHFANELTPPSTMSYFGCKSPSGSPIPCLFNGLTDTTSFTADNCINAGELNTNQTITIPNLSALNLTYFRADLSFCFVIPPTIDAGGSVTIAITLVGGQMISTTTQLVNQNKFTSGNCSEFIQFPLNPPTSPTINDSIDSIQIDMTTIAGFEIQSLTLFEPLLCSSGNEIYRVPATFQAVEQAGAGEPIRPKGFLECPQEGFACAASGVAQEDVSSKFFIVPSFNTPREFFVATGADFERKYSIQLDRSNVYLFAGQSCFERTAVPIPIGLLTIASPPATGTSSSVLTLSDFAIYSEISQMDADAAVANVAAITSAKVLFVKLFQDPTLDRVIFVSKSIGQNFPDTVQISANDQSLVALFKSFITVPNGFIFDTGNLGSVAQNNADAVVTTVVWQIL